MPQDMMLSEETSWYKTHPDSEQICDNVLVDKYLQPSEKEWPDLVRRLCLSLTPAPIVPLHTADRCRQRMLNRQAVPAGRVLAGAGTAKNVTLFNCFVAPEIQDSMRTEPDLPGKGIMDALSEVAFSMQMGGGVGTAFGPIRPKGAMVEKIQAEASGPLNFMDMWDAMCRTIMSAGYRRGAMMATLPCDHPDVLDFITAKHDGQRLRMFNVSVLIYDSFMRCVAEDKVWELGHWVRPFYEKDIVRVTERFDPRRKEHRMWFVYKVVKARDLWDEIMRSTYNYAEPGTIFVDVINRYNNLSYCEYIDCTNPCGEQPLPPNQNCDLSHNNLSRLVKGKPFTDECEVDWFGIEETTRCLVHLSDRVIDVSALPTEDQRLESQAKRRIGIGITGLANMMMFMRMRYGDDRSIQLCHSVMRCIRDAAYLESVELAKVHGPFPAYDRDLYMESLFVKTLPDNIKQAIYENGIRNSHLLTIAPTGTNSIAACMNSSSGLEPVFAFRQNRKILQPDNTFRQVVLEDFGFRTFANCLFNGDAVEAVMEINSGRLEYMVTAANLSVDDHLNVQAALQPYIDSSISKTINVPEDIPFDTFKEVYTKAYSLGAKGCTTYRPNKESGRGSILENADAIQGTVTVHTTPVVRELRERPEKLKGETVRLRWPTYGYPMFLTINDKVENGRQIPFEIFINSKGSDYRHWIDTVTRLVSSIMRKGGDLTFLIDELKSVWSAKGAQYIEGRWVGSEVAYIGLKLEEHFIEIGYMEPRVKQLETPQASGEMGEECPCCHEPAVFMMEGCMKCQSCDFSNCG